MKIDFLFAGLNLNIMIQKKSARKMHVLWITILKTRGINFNVETWILFALRIKISGYASAFANPSWFKYGREFHKLEAIRKKVKRL